MNHRICLLLFWALPFCLSYAGQNTVSSGIKRYVFEHRSMGTLFRVICYSDNEELVQDTKEKAFRRIDELNQIMSDYLPDSELMNLSRQSGSGRYVKVSDELYEIIRLGIAWSKQTKGIFDITIGPLTQLWRRAGRQDKLPTRKQIKYARKHTGYKKIHIDSEERAVKLKVEGMQLDLGGIAKGYTVDEVFRIFAEAGMDQVLVDGGGDIRTGNPPPGKTGWRIVLENLEADPHVMFLSNTSIATSGDMYRYVIIDSIRYGHIIDPRSGYGITVPRTSTVLAPTCLEADVLASVLCVWGPDKGIDFISSMPEIKAVIVQEEAGEIQKYMSEAWID